MRTLVFDTETTGKIDYRMKDVRGQPHMVQLGAILYEDGATRAELNLIVNPGVPVPDEAAAIHGITSAIAERYGVRPSVAIAMFNNLLRVADRVSGHNLDFDLTIVSATLAREGKASGVLSELPRVCTMHTLTDVCQLPGKYGFKWPTLQEAHKHFFGKEFEDAHDAMADVRATGRVLAEIDAQGIKTKAGKL